MSSTCGRESVCWPSSFTELTHLRHVIVVCLALTAATGGDRGSIYPSRKSGRCFLSFSWRIALSHSNEVNVEIASSRSRKQSILHFFESQPEIQITQISYRLIRQYLFSTHESLECLFVHPIAENEVKTLEQLYVLWKKAVVEPFIEVVPYCLIPGTQVKLHAIWSRFPYHLISRPTAAFQHP